MVQRLSRRPEPVHARPLSCTIARRRPASPPQPLHAQPSLRQRHGMRRCTLTFDTSTMESIQLKVDGMSCGSCVASVTRVLQKVPSVSTVEVDLPSGVATVTAQDSAATVPALIAALAAAGYKAGPLPTTEPAAAPHACPEQAAPSGCRSGRASKQAGGCCCH